MKTAALECRNLRFGYSESPVLDDVGFSMFEGDLVGVIGPNGAGKTTLIKLLSGLLEPARGTVALKGTDINSFSRQQIARELAVVSQEERPDFGSTVREEVMLGRAPHHGGLHFDSGPDHLIVESSMEKTRVDSLADRKLASLSGGERQRVKIARGLAQEPRLLLLDEPTNHLDLYSQMSLMELMREINQDGPGILLVSHDINFVAEVCEHIHILHRGRFRFTGSPSGVITEANIAASFNIRALVDTNPVTGKPRMTPLHRLAAP